MPTLSSHIIFCTLAFTFPFIFNFLQLINNSIILDVCVDYISFMVNSVNAYKFYGELVPQFSDIE